MPFGVHEVVEDIFVGPTQNHHFWWPRGMPCHVMASHAMPGHIFACHAIFLRVMPCHEYSMPFHVRIFWGKYVWKNIFRNVVPDFLTCPRLVGTWVKNVFRNLVPDFWRVMLFLACHVLNVACHGVSISIVSLISVSCRGVSEFCVSAC